MQQLILRICAVSHLYLGSFAHTLKDPFCNSNALEIIEEGGLLVGDNGEIEAIGTRSLLLSLYPEIARSDYAGSWILPGMIDGHIHYPQCYATASYGAQLLDWLKNSIFPEEIKFLDQSYAAKAAQAFTHQLLANGTTTALVFGSQFPHAMESLFEAARQAGIRLISGLTLMDRSAPEELLTSPELAYSQSLALINQIADDPLLHYAVTPRFAISCTPAMLEVCGQLLRENPESYLQTHINENLLEIQNTQDLFPAAKNYLDVYDRYGLLNKRSVLAHSVHSTQAEIRTMAERNLTVCHCPCSNLVLGSGLFKLASHLEHRIKVMVGTDVGGGTHFCMLEEIADVYKVQQLHSHCLDAAQLLYLATLAGARGLGLDTGNFIPGKSADFMILSSDSDPYLKKRLHQCTTNEQQLFALINLANGNHVKATYVAGRCVYDNF